MTTTKPRPVHALTEAPKKGYLPPSTLCFRDPFRKGVRVSFPGSLSPEPVTCPACLKAMKEGA